MLAPRFAPVQPAAYPSAGIQIAHYGLKIGYLAEWCAANGYPDATRARILEHAGEYNRVQYPYSPVCAARATASTPPPSSRRESTRSAPASSGASATPTTWTARSAPKTRSGTRSSTRLSSHPHWPAWVWPPGPAPGRPVTTDRRSGFPESWRMRQ